MLLDIVYLIALVFASPIILYRILIKGKDRKTLLQRLGRIAKRRADIWVHGVSVGEMKAAQPLIQELEKLYPDKKIVVTSTSLSGLSVAREMFTNHWVLPFPFDFSWAVKRYLRIIQPQLVVLVELEIWPNFLRVTRKREIPVLLVNGRFSEKSSRRYGYLGSFFRYMTRGIHCFSVQNQLYAKRLEKLGVAAERISITGNMKFDTIAIKQSDQKSIDEWKKICQIKDDDCVIIAGSTHDPEEKILLQTYAKLLKENFRLRLLIVPRHPERREKIAKYVKDVGCQPHFLSAMKNTNLKSKDVIIGDVMGKLFLLYGIADVAFVGGSLIPHGGQNFIEPAMQKKAVLCGPNMQNFPDIKLFVEKKTILQIKSEEELYKTLQLLLKSPNQINKMGNEAALLIRDLQGSLAKNLDFCRSLIELHR